MLPATTPFETRDAERVRRTKRSTRCARLLWFPVAWGVILFGGVYAWAYDPLLAWVAAVGVYGWWSAPSRHKQPARGVAAALILIACVVSLQLAPLPTRWLQRVSPGTDAAARRTDVAYAMARASGAPVLHPISIAPEQTMKGLSMLGALAVFLVGATAIMPRVRLKWLTRRIAALGLAIGLFGIVQRATFNGRIYWVFAPINVASNAFGPFVNRNHFAGWMLMTASLTAGCLCSLLVSSPRRVRHSWREWFAVLASAADNRVLFLSCALTVMTLSIVWTLSRSGIAAFAAATAILSERIFARTRGVRRFATLAFLVAIIPFALLWRGLDTVSDWYSHTNTLQWRFQLWHDTAAIVRDFPWFGTGLDTYGVSTLLYPMTDPRTHAIEAHNDYVQILSEGGVALALAAVFAAWQLARAIHSAFAESQTSSLYWIRVGATVGLLGIAVQELSDFSLQMPGNAVLFCILAAIAMHRAPSHERPELSR